MVAYPNTRAMCSANCDGAAAAVLVSSERLKSMSSDQRRRAVKIEASVLTSDSWEPGCQVLPDFNSLTRIAARAATSRSEWMLLISISSICTTASPGRS